MDKDITDEELAKWETALIPGTHFSAAAVNIIRRLIAALRASRQVNEGMAVEVQRLNIENARGLEELNRLRRLIQGLYEEL